MSPGHLVRYVKEFADRHGVRGRDTFDQTGRPVLDMQGKKLRQDDLRASSRLSSGARSGQRTGNRERTGCFARSPADRPAVRPSPLRMTTMREGFLVSQSIVHPHDGAHEVLS